MIAFINHCITVCKGNSKKEEGSKVDLHFFSNAVFLQKKGDEVEAKGTKATFPLPSVKNRLKV